PFCSFMALHPTITNTISGKNSVLSKTDGQKYPEIGRITPRNVKHGLNEHPVNALDDEAWDDFVAALDAPVEIDPAVKARYARKPQWNRWDRPSRSRRATTSRSSPRASPPSTPGSAARQG
ncbi:MAG: hypothetical protein OXI81_12840, partial [Paracoccaceae bacterium]|nr:hypothetical protein [Paracoccaceae bacterium]